MAKKSVVDVVVEEQDKGDLAKLVKSFGDVIVTRERGVSAISSGSHSLDASIGIGGFPRGRFTEMYGPEGSGKTTVALSAAKGVIENGGKVLYIDAEIMLSHDAIEVMLGQALNPDQFILVHPENAESAFMIIESVIATGEIDLVVVDTVAALGPKAELKKDLDEFTVAEISRLLPKFFRRNAQKVEENNVAVLFLNQVRDKVGSYTQGYSSPGGHALKHYTSVIVALTKGGNIKVGSDTLGIKAKFVIRKNKLAPPFRSFTIPITFGKGIDYAMDVLEFCEMLGVVKKGGSFYKFNGETIGQGKVAASNKLEENPDVLKAIIDKTYEVISGGKPVDIDSLEESFAPDESSE